MTAKKGKIYIGTSGFNYRHWADGVFYPSGLAAKKWLEYYSENFRTVELNVTFYRLPKPGAFDGWLDRVPKDFRYFIKGSRYITHIKRLRDTVKPLKKLFALTEHLEKKLSGVLWQLPPSMKINLQLLEKFLKNLEAYKTRHAFEFRHISWWDKDVFDLLKKYKATFVDADYLKKFPASPLDYNFGFYYIRRHGTTDRYSGKYSKDQLNEIAKKAKKFRRAGKDVFVYFNNDAFGYAVKNAKELIEITG